MLLPSPFFTHINTRYLKKHVTKNEKSPGCKAFSVSGPQSWRNEIRKRNSWPCRSSVWLKTCFSIFCWVGSWFYFQEFFKGQFFFPTKNCFIMFHYFSFSIFCLRATVVIPRHHQTPRIETEHICEEARRLFLRFDVVRQGSLTLMEASGSGGFNLVWRFSFVWVSVPCFKTCFFFFGEAYETEVLRDQRNIQSSSINSWYSNRSLERSN